MADDKTPEGEQPETPAVPEYIEERFRSAENPLEAQARGYAEAQREMNRLRSESERERKQFTEALTQLEAAQTPAPVPFNPNADPLVQLAQKAWEEGDMATFLAVNAQINQAATRQVLAEEVGPLKEQMTSGNKQDRALALQMAEERVKGMYGDRWETEIAPEINKRLAHLPAEASVEGFVEFLTREAQAIDYPRLKKQLDAAEAERTAKLNANTLGGGGARVPLQADENKEHWDRVKAANSGSWSGVVGS